MSETVQEEEKPDLEFFREEVNKAREAMGNGADDVRWCPGETAVDALIRERDSLRDAVRRAELALKYERFLHDATRGQLESSTRCGAVVVEQVKKARAEVERLRRVVEAARALLGWKMQAAYEHLTKEEADLRRAMVEAWEPT